MSCSTVYYPGLGACKSFRERVAGVVLTNKGTSLNKISAKELSAWLGVLAAPAGITGIYVPFDRGYQNNSPEPEMTQSNLGYSEKTADFPPVIKGFGNISYADYKALFSADNADFDVYLVLKDGTIEGAELSSDALKFKGYRGRVFVRFNAPSADNLQESYPFDIVFQDVNEWKSRSVQIFPDFTPTEILDSVPAGLDVVVKTAYAAGGDVTVKVTKRNQSAAPYAGLTLVTNWEILVADADLDVAVTAVDATNAALGEYILTIQGAASSVPADLTADVTIRAIHDDATNVDYISAPLKINV